MIPAGCVRKVTETVAPSDTILTKNRPGLFLRRWLIGLLCMLAGFAAAGRVLGADSSRAKRVLVLSTGSRFSPGFPIVEQGVIDELRKLHAGDLEFYSEYLDIVRFPSKSFHWLFRDYLRNKYVDDVPDVIVLVFVGNLVVARQLLNDIFPGTPVVAVGLTEEELSRSKVSQDLTGIVQRSDPGGTIELILRLQPEIQRILLIGGVAEVDRQVMARATLAARSFSGRVEFEVWDKRSMVEVLQAVTVLSPRTAILFTRMFRDGAGRAVNSSQAVQAVAKVSNVPVYLMTDPGLGTGAVGGSVANIPALGKRAGELAERILSGAVPNSLPLEILTNRRADLRLACLKTLGHQRKPAAAQQHHSFPSAIDVGAISLVHHRSASAVLAAGGFDYRLGLESNQTAPG